MSRTAEEPLRPKGTEMLVVNASLVGVTMKVVDASVLVDIEMPVADV